MLKMNCWDDDPVLERNPWSRRHVQGRLRRVEGGPERRPDGEGLTGFRNLGLRPCSMRRDDGNHQDMKLKRSTANMIAEFQRSHAFRSKPLSLWQEAQQRSAIPPRLFLDSSRLCSSSYSCTRRHGLSSSGHAAASTSRCQRCPSCSSALPNPCDGAAPRKLATASMLTRKHLAPQAVRQAAANMMLRGAIATKAVQRSGAQECDRQRRWGIQRLQSDAMYRIYSHTSLHQKLCHDPSAKAYERHCT